MSNEDIRVIPSRSPLECADEMATYIERASCAVSVLGELLAAIPEEDMDEGAIQSLGYLMKILGDGMFQRSMDSYAYLGKCRGKELNATASDARK
jgi:hypothetical protein